MAKDLPVRPNIDHLKAQAKDLLDAYQRGDSDALARFREGLPSAKGKSDGDLASMKLALHDAQSVVAREYGFASFADLGAHVDSVARDREPLHALMATHPNAPLPPQVLDAMTAASAKVERTAAITSATSFPLVPLRGALITVGAVVPISVGRPSSLAAIEAASASSGLLVVFSQKDAANEAPGRADLHPVGCIVQLISKLDMREHGTFSVVRGAQWVRLDDVQTAGAHLVARVSPFDIAKGDAAEVARVEAALRKRVAVLTSAMPGGDRLRAMTDRMNALELADATVANLPCSVADKAAYASESTVIARLECALALAAALP